MSEAFPGWTEAAQRFFLGLELDNSREYFEANRRTYERDVRGPMLALLAAVEPEFGPGKVFRPNRDVRFSADKSPYKTNVAAVVGDGRRVSYVSLSAKGLFIAAGRYRLDRDELTRFREAVAEQRSGEAVERIVGRLELDGYEIGGEALKIVPRQFARDHPRGRLLRHAGLTMSRSYDLEPWLDTPEALERVVAVWRDAGPLQDWLVAALT